MKDYTQEIIIILLIVFIIALALKGNNPYIDDVVNNLPYSVEDGDFR